MKVEVLITTMHQHNSDLYRKMNLQTDAVIANQADVSGYKETVINNHRVRLITTDSRGVSRNRNIAIAHSSQDADVLLFSDDDLIFNDGYEEQITDEFLKHPEAEAIKFNLHDLSNFRKYP